MKYMEEFRDPEFAQTLLKDIHQITKQEWAIMEVCGGQTNTIMRNGIDRLLPKSVELIHGRVPDSHGWTLKIEV